MRWVAEHFAQLVSIAGVLQTRAEWLAQTIWLESAGHPNAINSSSGATGIIQWMPKFFQKWGTREDLMARGLEGQLRLVQEWLLPYRGKLVSDVDCYLAVFLPAMMRGADVVAPKRSMIAVANPTLCGADGAITRDSIRAALNRNFPATWRHSIAVAEAAPSWSAVQHALARRGWYQGSVDGIPGPKTCHAVERAISELPPIQDTEPGTPQGRAGNA